MIKKRCQWRQQEPATAKSNVFEAQMHAKMRRQSLKRVETRPAQEMEADCMTLDLSSARLSKDSHYVHDPTVGKVHDIRTRLRSRQWVPHAIEEEFSSPSSSDDSERVFPVLKHYYTRPTDDLVLKLRQELTQDAKFRLERLGGFDVSRAVPTFVYRVFLDNEENQYSGNATDGSEAIHRLPPLLHNSRVNLAYW
ncbi:unnamed protein product [Peronospora destructor]|uniref:Uncharacterized protein n=1 Tax=Peronospora destructor TaxID=86335 RepID=A0AAV0U4X7_9STRA|nr:unnamed protein product [Peronospora destructor]